MMSQDGSSEVDSARRRDLVHQDVIKEFVGKVEPGGEVSLATALGTVGFSLVVVFGTTAWWMLH
jgi:hypothetical protein